MQESYGSYSWIIFYWDKHELIFSRGCTWWLFRVYVRAHVCVCARARACVSGCVHVCDILHQGILCVKIFFIKRSNILVFSWEKRELIYFLFHVGAHDEFVCVCVCVCCTRYSSSRIRYAWLLVSIRCISWDNSVIFSSIQDGVCSLSAVELCYFIFNETKST